LDSSTHIPAGGRDPCSALAEAGRLFADMMRSPIVPARCEGACLQCMLARLLLAKREALRHCPLPFARPFATAHPFKISTLTIVLTEVRLFTGYTRHCDSPIWSGRCVHTARENKIGVCCHVPEVHVSMAKYGAGGRARIPKIDARG
jgi:hypothetical protein